MPGDSASRSVSPALVLGRRLDQVDERRARSLEAEVLTDAASWALRQCVPVARAAGPWTMLSELVNAARRGVRGAACWAALFGEAEIVAMAGDLDAPALPLERRFLALWAKEARRGRSTWTPRAPGVASAFCAIPLRAQGVLVVRKFDEDFSVGEQERLYALGRTFSELLAPEPPRSDPGGTILGGSAAIQDLRAALVALAAERWPTVFQGAPGTGRELAARELHRLSPDSGAPFWSLRCGALEPIDLDRMTRRLEAPGVGTVFGVSGTIFLADVETTRTSLQGQLARALRAPALAGSRLMASAGRPLHGDDRAPLHDELRRALSGLVLRLPTLQERREDIPILAAFFVERARPSEGVTLSPAAAATLSAAEWPGQVAELERVVLAAVARLRSDERLLRPSHFEGLDGEGPPVDLQGQTETFQRERVLAALRTHGGNRTQAAAALGVSRQWLHRLLRRWEASGGQGGAAHPPGPPAFGARALRAGARETLKKS